MATTFHVVGFIGKCKTCKIPVRADVNEERERVAKPVREFFTAQVKARESYKDLLAVFDPTDFATRP